MKEFSPWHDLELIPFYKQTLSNYKDCLLVKGFYPWHDSELVCYYKQSLSNYKDCL